MADLSITAASVLAGSGTTPSHDYPAGEAVTAGQVVYLKSADSKWWKAQHDGTAEESGYGVRKGIALHASGAGQPLSVLETGSITIGATIAAGVVYYLSGTGGGICPVADLSTADYVTVLGYGESTTVMKLLITATGVALA